MSFHEESVSAAPKKKKKKKKRKKEKKKERKERKKEKRKLYLGVFDMAMQGHRFE